jgi:hypothetical protein
LGSARYVGDSCVSTSGFVWSLRSTSGAPAPVAAHARYLEDHQWVVHTVDNGRPGEAEFRVSRELPGSGEVRIAVGLMLAGDDPEPRGWPMGPDEDGCTQRSTIAGPIEERLHFDPRVWTSVLGLTGDR